MRVGAGRSVKAFPGPTPLALLLAFLVAAAAAAADQAARRAQLRSSSFAGGGGQRAAATAATAAGAKEVPGWGNPRWGGRSFSDSIANYNPWGKVRRATVVADLDPIAPMDRVDKNTVDSIVGVVPLPPTDESDEAYESGIRNDWVAPYSFPRTFAAEGDSEEDPEAPVTPLANKRLVAHMDQLRTPNRWRAHGHGNYPLVAPADRLTSSRQKILGSWFGTDPDSSPWAAADEDHVHPRFSKYFEQVHDRERRRQQAVTLNIAYYDADKDRDGAVSREEYDQLMVRQNRTAEDAEKLWGRYHSSPSQGMTKAEFGRLLRDGVVDPAALHAAAHPSPNAA